MFNIRLKELRNQKNMTQDELGKVLNVSGKTIGAWERDSRQPNIETINALANYFNVSTDYLLGRSEEKKSPSEDRENKDLKKFLEDNLDNGMTFGDGEVTEEDREKLEIALTQIFYRYHDEFKKRKEEKGGFKF